jgi:hypothetical protein
MLVSAAFPPPAPPALASVTFGVGDYPNDGGGFFRVIFTITNPVGGEYVEISYDISDGATPFTTLGPGGPVGPYTTSPADVSVALGGPPLYSPTPRASATVDLYDSGANLLDSVFLPDQPLPI